MNMPVSTPEELRACIAVEPHASPSIFLPDDSFAAWCYDHISLREARSAFQRDADPDECNRWRLTPLEWKAQMEMAVVALAAAEKQNK